jgi:hypothetical protein
MANYVAHYTKKKQILGRKELALRRLIDCGAAADKLMNAAAEVRDARVRVLRARRATIVPKDDAHVQYAKIDAQIEAVLDTSLPSILAEFGWKIQDADGHGAD